MRVLDPKSLLPTHQQRLAWVLGDGISFKDSHHGSYLMELSGGWPIHSQPREGRQPAGHHLTTEVTEPECGVCELGHVGTPCWQEGQEKSQLPEPVMQQTRPEVPNAFTPQICHPELLQKSFLKRVFSLHQSQTEAK